jgi:hypothetical protein
MNLLDKLKPEYKVVLVEKMEEYPSTKESIFKALTEKEFVIHLTIKEANDTAYYLCDKSFADIYELFKKE